MIKTLLLKKSPWFFGLLLTGIVCCFLYFLSSLSGAYGIVYGDEYFYVKNAESLFRHFSLRAAFTYSGLGSTFFGIDAHGPAYPLFYGGISKLFGWHILNIPFLNLAAFSLSLLLLIWKSSEDRCTLLLQLILILGCPVALFYSLTFMPELLNIAGGIALFVFVNAYLNQQTTKRLLALLGIILVLGIMRSTWFFAIFGVLSIQTKPQKPRAIVLIVASLAFPFLMQKYFHEQVPNAYSEAGTLITSGKIKEVLHVLWLNTKRNIYFLLHYTEGWFYTLQKIWMILSILVSLAYVKQIPLLRFALISLLPHLIFTFVLYKNYDWVDLRMHTAWILFLNLGLIACKAKASKVLIGINMMSFFLILPLISQLSNLRLHRPFKEIPDTIIQEIGASKGPTLLHIAPEILYDFALDQLPVSDQKGNPIRYILPYYELNGPKPSLYLEQINGQLRAYPKKSLCQ